jgi:hypothetical protein
MYTHEKVKSYRKKLKYFIKYLCAIYVPTVLTIYEPMIHTAPFIMFWMCAYPLRGEVGGVGPWNLRGFWAL